MNFLRISKGWFIHHHLPIIRICKFQKSVLHYHYSQALPVFNRRHNSTRWMCKFHLLPPTRYPEMQPPIKKSYKWVWIIVSIFGVGFLVTCGLCGWGAYQLFDTVINQETGATDVVNTYFQDVQNQRYAHAYQNLQISGLTLEDYSEAGTG